MSAGRMDTVAHDEPGAPHKVAVVRLPARKQPHLDQPRTSPAAATSSDSVQ